MIHDCISNDGKYIGSSEVVYQCPSCLRTERHPSVRAYTWFGPGGESDVPYCRCQQAGHADGIYLTTMQFVGIRPPIGFKLRDDIRDGGGHL